MAHHYFVNKYISVIKRSSDAYFDRKLSDYLIGCGQQFFLLQIQNTPGISFLQLADEGRYDKATATRAVKKLLKEGYVRLEIDEVDKRVRHIYLTETAIPVIERTREVLKEWNQLMMQELTPEEQMLAESLLLRMATGLQERSEQKEFLLPHANSKHR